jgi:IS605 OrfB family transposase
LQKAYYQLKCKRLDFFYKQSYEIFEKEDIVVVVEELDIGNMTKRPKAVKDEKTGEFLPNGAKNKSKLNTLIYDSSWGNFLRILKETAKKLGKLVVSVPSAYTSQQCSNCLELVKKSLSTRTHKCPHCEYEDDRDANAAKNILRLGTESLGFTLEATTILQCS